MGTSRYFSDFATNQACRNKLGSLTALRLRILLNFQEQHDPPSDPEADISANGFGVFKNAPQSLVQRYADVSAVNIEDGSRFGEIYGLQYTFVASGGNQKGGGDVQEEAPKSDSDDDH